ncbi:flagellar filament capping protein FliD [Clostridium sp. BL-8]|uniref:flagellar filament capping protein FliD n=1 Tax=Clostridium sp. BL-8 TaxID=349938 RepID=UPI00098CAD33|nr:flagellar filament capping protein FliD [Clostridium sp. BL-8]OOM79979.1 flagellar capping protein [Clostridium sp. BL-8]
MTTRITGLVSGLDVDALVEAGSSFYQNKLDQAKQKQQKLEWEQTAYKSIGSDVSTFYKKYLDITSDDYIGKDSNWNTNTYASSDSSIATASSNAGVSVNNYNISVTQLAASATTTITSMDSYTDGLFVSIDGGTTKIGLTSSEISNCGGDLSKIASALNSKLSGSGVSATYSSYSKGIVIKTDALGSSAKLNTYNISSSSDTSTAATVSVTGKNLHATITDGSGNDYIVGESTDTNVDKTGYNSNSLTVDGVNFNFTNTGTTTLTGSRDVSDLEDNIESFINDYNTLITSINTQYYASYDNDYQPLTDAQKKDMTDTQISSWNTQAQTGLLHGDKYLDTLASQMKDAMSTFMKSSGVDLESFGIKPVDDYTTKNGTYTVDSGKLTTALQDQSNFSKIQSLFLDGSKSITSYSTTNSKTDGIAAKLKVIFNNNVMTTTSTFSQLCGTDDNPVTATTNEFYKELQDQNDLITQYQDELSDKETALYNKYSQLESRLTELQSSSSVFSSSSS